MVESVTPAEGLLRRGWPWVLILLYWGTRLHNLDSLPIFLDEGIHIDWARLVWRLQPFHAASDGKLLSIWMQAMLWPFVGTLWVARVSTVLAATIGFAALIAFGRRLRLHLAAGLAGIIFVALPISIFFDRMALIDAVSAAEVMLLIHLNVHSLHSESRRGVRLTGLLLAVMLLTKLTNIVFIMVPLVAAFTLPNPGKRGLAWRQTGLIYLYAAPVLLCALFVLRYVGKSDLGLDLLMFKTGSGEGGLIYSARQSIGAIAEILWIMGTPAFCLASMAGAAMALWRRQPLLLYVCIVLVISIATLAVGTGAGYLESRYLVVNAPLVALLAGHALALAWRQIARASTRIGNGGMFTARVLAVMSLVVILWPGVRFLAQGWGAPYDLTIPPHERWEYITGWPSGYGFREIALDYRDRGNAVQLTTFDLGGRQRLGAYLPPESDVKPVQVSPDEFAAGVRPDPDDGPTLLLLDHPKDDDDLAWLELSLTRVSTYPRPGNESRLTVYEIGP